MVAADVEDLERLPREINMAVRALAFPNRDIVLQTERGARVCLPLPAAAAESAVAMLRGFEWVKVYVGQQQPYECSSIGQLLRVTP